MVEYLGVSGLDRYLTVTNVGIREYLFQQSRTIAVPTVRGSRTFDGATSYARAANNTARGADAVYFTTLADNIGISFAAWFSMTALPVSGAATLMCYAGDEASFVAADASVWSLRMGTFGQLFMRITSNDGITNIDDTCPRFNAVAGEIYHVGLVWEADPTIPGGLFKRTRWYINGRCMGVGSARNMTGVASGGSTARWFLGARPTSSTTRVDFMNGALCDCVLLAYGGSTEWFRRTYARGVQDFTIGTEDPNGIYNVVANVRHPSLQLFEAHTRVLIQDRFEALLDNGVNSRAPSDTRAYRQADPEGFVDVTEMYGWNWLLEATIDEAIDNQAQSATVRLVTRIGEMNVAPYSFGSDNPVNRNDIFLRENNRVKIEIACVPLGTGRAGAFPHWLLRFDGFITKVDASDDVTEISCIDRMAPLQDVWIEPNPRTGQDYEYGSTPGTAVETVIQNIIDDNDPAKFEILTIDDNGSGGVTLVTIMQPATAPARGKPGLFQFGDQVWITGTGRAAFDTQTNQQPYTVDLQSATGFVQLTWVPTLNGYASPASSSAGIMRASQELLGYIGRKPKLYTPTSPGWLVNPYALPASSPVSTAIENLASSIGYCVRSAWDDERQEFRVTLSKFRAIDLFRLSIQRVMSVTSQAFDKENARTVLVTEYEDSTDVDNTNQAIRHTVFAVNVATRRRYGRRYARVGLASYDLVNTLAEAQAFTNDLASDMANPEAETEIEMLFNPLAVIGGAAYLPEETEYAQVITRAFAVGSRLLTVGVVGVTTSCSNDGVTTRLKTRQSQNGTTLTRKHTELFQQIGYVPGKGLLPPSTSGITGALRTTRIQAAGATPCGCHVSWTHPNRKGAAAWDETEVHASGTSGFTPDAASYRGTTRGTSFTVAGLLPSTTHYFKIILRDRMGNQSAAINLGSAVTPA